MTMLVYRKVDLGLFLCGKLLSTLESFKAHHTLEAFCEWNFTKKNLPSEDEKKHETVECRKVIALKYTT